ncbi:unnamed protein product [Mesocestoides corti]|uniref:Prostate androgen-regulated mucin-like protein 1 n=1 Tax=Mesocestoides corti TaxID=53468 RepID=A0A0R3UQZ7_MESCO|nr:unnamed protein product [Mesocestoides corti]
MAPGHHIPLAHAASQFEEISAITIPPTESPLHRHKTPSPDTDDHFLTTSDSTGSGPESESVTASSRMDEESVSYHTNTPPNSDIKLYTDSEPALTSFATSSGTPTPNIPGSLSRYHTDPSLTATLVQSDEDSSFREVNSPHRKGLLTFSENGTVTNSVLLTVTAGDLSATNLAMIIIIVSLISLVCIAVIVWFFCVHKN